MGIRIGLNAVMGESLLPVVKLYGAPKGTTVNWIVLNRADEKYNVENVTNLVGAEIIFTYDVNSVSFNSVSKGSFLLSAPNNFVIEEHDSSTGTVTLTLSTAQDEGDGLTGSGSLITVSFTLLPSITDVFILEFSDQCRYIEGSSLITTERAARVRSPFFEVW